MFPHLFADDVQLYKFFSAPEVSRCVINIVSDLNAVGAWAARNQLALNASKSQAMVIGSNANVKMIPVTDVDGKVDYAVLVANSEGGFTEFPPLQLNGENIRFLPVSKNLGLYMNYRMTWFNHVEVVNRKVFTGLASLWPLASSTPLRTRLLLAKSLLLPHFIYCCEISSYGLEVRSVKLLDKAQVLQVLYKYLSFY